MPETEIQTENDMIARMNAAGDEKLPFVVAIHRRPPPIQGPSIIREAVVGYAYLKDYGDKTDLPSDTCELKVCTHPYFTGKGIGRSMIDRVLLLTNPKYTSRGGYVWEDDADSSQHEPKRVINTINLSLEHEENEKTNFGWVIEMMKRCGFNKTGKTPGFKKGKV